ncbi:MAG TPA: carbohydrate ABC transporter permease, partial [Candidatus Limiplasma sp.]|nr:carbohydrate ABC transporter permease [Candidatus Limiplasma sp.]
MVHTTARRKLRKRSMFPLVNTLAMILLMFITLYPVINTIAISLNDGTDAVRGGIGLWPRVFSTKSYETIFVDESIYNAFFITISRTIIQTLINVVLTAMLSFALSRREYVLRKFITMAFVLTMYVNAGLIPNYLLLQRTLG